MKPIFYRFSLLVVFALAASCKPAVYVAGKPAATVIGVSQGNDSLSAAIIAPYKEKLDAEINRVIGYAEKDMSRDTPGDLVYFISDAALAEAREKTGMNIDLSVMNRGGVRIPEVKAGPIKVNTLFELMPFENEIFILTLDGPTTRELFEYMAVDRGTYLSNCRVRVRDQQPVEILIGGSPFDPGRTYTLVVSDYLSAGGSNMHFLKKALDKKVLNLKYRDMLIRYVEKQHAQGKKVGKIFDSALILEN